MYQRDKLGKRLQERMEKDRLYKTPENRRLKYAALAVIAIAIMLLLSMAIWIEEISTRTMLLMRGCAGLCAIIFGVLVGILTYRVNKQYINNRRN